MRSAKGSSQQSSRFFLPESLPRATSDGALAPVETTGEFFPDGVNIALIGDWKTRLESARLRTKPGRIGLWMLSSCLWSYPLRGTPRRNHGFNPN
jgi:hypothetical protein